jgi:hypothetical protein
MSAVDRHQIERALELRPDLLASSARQLEAINRNLAFAAIRPQTLQPGLERVTQSRCASRARLSYLQDRRSPLIRRDSSRREARPRLGVDSELLGFVEGQQ